jgi:dihydroflavonol-4-reductase
VIVAVTGASGFLGSHVALALAAAGHTVRAVVRDPGKAAWLGVDAVRGDLGDRASLVAAFAGCDAVVDNAALLGRDRAPYAEFLAANVGGAEAVLGAAADARVSRIVKISTIAVHRMRLFAMNDRDTANFADVRVPVGWGHVTTNWRYALSKARGEARSWELARERGLAMTSIRPGPIYGPRDGKLTASYAKIMARKLAFLPTARVPHVHAGDVAGAVLGALANPDSAGRAYTVCGPLASPYEVIGLWKRLAGGGPVLVPIPVPLHVRWDDGHAIRDLAFAARSVEDGLRDVLASSAA